MSIEKTDQTPSQGPVSGVPPGYRYFSLITGLFVASLLISNVAAQKLIPIGPFVFTGGIILFPVTYIFGDVMTETYGYAKARQAIWAGFAGNLMMAALLALVIALPPAPGWNGQREFEAALTSVPRVVAASLAGYWLGEFVNSWVLARLKVKTGGRALWLRTIGSTLAGQAVDTVAFALIAFWGVFPAEILTRVIWSGYAFKVCYEVVATPITYLIVNNLKRLEGVDVFDSQTNLTPFRLRIGDR